MESKHIREFLESYNLNPNEVIYGSDDSAHWLVDILGGFLKESIETNNSELLERYNEAIEVLEELVQVKEWKDEYGKDAQYLKAQPIAWKNAQSVLNKALKQPNIK